MAPERGHQPRETEVQTIIATAYRVTFSTGTIEIETAVAHAFDDGEAIDIARDIIESETGFIVPPTALAEATPIESVELIID